MTVLINYKTKLNKLIYPEQVKFNWILKVPKYYIISYILYTITELKKKQQN